MASQPDSSQDSENPYYGFQYRKMLIIVALVLLCFFVGVFSIMSGDYRIGFAQVIEAIFLPNDEVYSIVVHNIRLPRILAAVIIGAALGLAGTVMQCVLKNPLASPYTLGISNAAAFGAALAIAASYLGFMGGMKDFLNTSFGMSIFAFLMSMVAVLVVLMFARSAYSSPENMVLAGTAMGSIFGAGLSSLQYFVDSDTLSSIVFWQFGDLSKASWQELEVIFLALLVIAVYLYLRRLDFNAMVAGDEVAESLGVKTRRLTYVTMILSSVLAALSISVVGIIGFIGLLGPHIMRRIIGNDHRFLIPASMAMGALVLLVSDAIGRLAFGTVIPVGIITSFLGGPLFLYILIKRRRSRTA